MEDQFGKYLRLFGSIFFLVIGFVVSLALLLLLFKLIFGLLVFVPWVVYIYAAGIVLIPPVLFITVYVIYFRRTMKFPNKPVRWISYAIFSIALITWIVVFGLDVMLFFKTASTNVGSYYGYDMIFLIANVACIFIVGVIQALTTEKEKDWMERSNR